MPYAEFTGIPHAANLLYDVGIQADKELAMYGKPLNPVRPRRMDVRH
ncbi:hypothetical protein ND436_002845 [Neisseria gonorrhoeae]|nr:hypothetical protein [Neisseria gonorrhoeae]UYP52479.1 hypothetical protein ND436_002845 [Neisseria gonorrhoeae]